MTSAGVALFVLEAKRLCRLWRNDVDSSCDCSAKTLATCADQLEILLNSFQTQKVPLVTVQDFKGQLGQ